MRSGRPKHDQTQMAIRRFLLAPPLILIVAIVLAIAAHPEPAIACSPTPTPSPPPPGFPTPTPLPPGYIIAERTAASDTVLEGTVVSVGTPGGSPATVATVRVHRYFKAGGLNPAVVDIGVRSFGSCVTASVSEGDRLIFFVTETGSSSYAADFNPSLATSENAAQVVAAAGQEPVLPSLSATDPELLIESAIDTHTPRIPLATRHIIGALAIGLTVCIVGIFVLRGIRRTE
jgi:hypothetical protein